jgi:hypothetical protein
MYYINYIRHVGKFVVKRGESKAYWRRKNPRIPNIPLPLLAFDRVPPSKKRITVTIILVWGQRLAL